MVIFGASGNLTRRLLAPALYNLACDGLLPRDFAIVGVAMDDWTTEHFRDHVAKHVRQFGTRPTVDEAVLADFVGRMHYAAGRFDDAATFQRLKAAARELGATNLLFYMATPPSVFGLISRQLRDAGFAGGDGWRRIIVEKPFGKDLGSAVALNREILQFWREEQVFRIDHYLGKETVQNLLTFRFANGIFEPLWNRHFIDHIQFTVAESVGVEQRGAYYESVGVLRDMIQNHMFQMVAYLCMEPPASFAAEAVRNEKAKLLDAVRVMSPVEVARDTVRGQYGPGVEPGYREEPNVSPTSSTETFAALKLSIDNWRWEGVPIYLRSGKRMWKRGTEIVVQFKRPPETLFRGTGVDRAEPNRLIFHMQPDQGIELRVQAKVPGPALQLQDVNLRFAYGDAFRGARAIGYEVLLYNCMIGDATLFSRTDLVESAWRIAQPMLDHWGTTAPGDFPNYPAGSWGPKAAWDLLERDGRRWYEVVTREVLQRVPLFAGCDPVFLASIANMLEPDVFAPGDLVVRKGDEADAMFVIARGEVEVLGEGDEVVTVLREGDFFGEVGLLHAVPRIATVRARTACDVFSLERHEFRRALADHPHFAAQVMQKAGERYRAGVTTPA
jgi:glucose-6-phosphate 1-dehydrogenase